MRCLSTPHTAPRTGIRYLGGCCKRNHSPHPTPTPTFPNKWNVNVKKLLRMLKESVNDTLDTPCLFEIALPHRFPMVVQLQRSQDQRIPFLIKY